jgi:hypothetical protein
MKPVSPHENVHSEADALLYRETPENAITEAQNELENETANSPVETVDRTEREPFLTALQLHQAGEERSEH